MEGKHDIVAPIFKTTAAKLQADNIELTIFKGANPSLATDIAKVVIRYAH